MRKGSELTPRRSRRAEAGARAVGPAVGAAVAGAWGMSGSFWVPAIVLAFMGGMVRMFVHAKAPKVHRTLSGEESASGTAPGSS